jgi:hypothetical protein
LVQDQGRPIIKVGSPSLEIEDLKQKIKEVNPSLSLVNPGNIRLFPHGVNTTNNDNALESYDTIPENTSGKNPLIVIVSQYQQDGKSTVLFSMEF